MYIDGEAKIYENYWSYLYFIATAMSSFKLRRRMRSLLLERAKRMKSIH